MKSIIQSERECFFCGNPHVVCHHVIYGMGYRQIAEDYGLTVWLCPRHHNMSRDGVHMNKERDLELKRFAQKVFEEKYSHELWMEKIGRNYL